MRKICVLLIALLLFPVLASAEMVSISELREQAKAMGDRWQKSYHTPNGMLDVDVPIVIPDAENCPVLTVEKAKPLSDDLLRTILSGKRGGGESDPAFEIERDGAAWEFMLETNGNGATTDHGKITEVWIQRGQYRTSGDSMEYATPVTRHYPWELDLAEPYARDTDQTVGEAMTIWQEHIDLCYPDGEYTIAPKRITVYGSTLSSETEEDEYAKQRGYYSIVAEQLISGFPLFGAIASPVSSNSFFVFHPTAGKETDASKKLSRYRAGSFWTCYNRLEMSSADDENHRTQTSLNRVRTTEYDDVPLASLDQVMAGIEAEIEEGRIREVFSLRLGYLLYSNPDMKDYAWAVPRWVLDCHYVMPENEKSIEAAHEHDIDNELNIWNTPEFLQMPIDAQSGKPILFTSGDEDVFAVPEMITWEDVQ